MEAALSTVAGQAATGIVSPPVAALVERASRAMFLSKAKLTALVLAAGLVATAVGSHLHRAGATPVEGESATLPTARAEDKPAEKKPATTAKEKDKIVLHGRVLDPDGKPLAGATLFFLPTADEDDAPKAPPEEAKSGAEGRFHFAVNRSHLVHGRWLAARASFPI